MRINSAKFSEELKAAGLLGLPFSWGEDGSLQVSQLTAAQQKVVKALAEAHDPSVPSKFEQIAALENQVTQRRIREAVLGTDGGWLAGIESQIAKLRG